MFPGNTHYSTEEEFLYAVADAMKPEYQAIVNAGLLLQLDCPDLATTHHREFANSPVEDFREYARKHIEVLRDRSQRVQCPLSTRSRGIVSDLSTHAPSRNSHVSPNTISPLCPPNITMTPRLLSYAIDA